MMLLASALPFITASLTVCGMVYSILVLWALRSFRAALAAEASSPLAAAEAPGVSILKPLHGLDPRMRTAFASHCEQHYPGPYEILFGVGSLEDEAVPEVARLRVEYPDVSIHLVVCPERLGPNGKLSTLAQILPHARYEHVVVNDSDIAVSPEYLSRVMAPFGRMNTGDVAGSRQQAPVGLVTVPYNGRAEATAWSRLEALGISTDFIPGVLVARLIEGGLHFGLGSTLATTRTALGSIGGFEALTDQLADDYELGARLSRAGYRVELAGEVVATTVPAYTLRSFAEHQLRWARSTRDSRQAGYLGLAFTYLVPWALATVVASGFALWAVTLLSVALLLRMTVALSVGVGLLRDGQVLRDLAYVPVRDVMGLFLWGWSYASDAVVWRGERFQIRRGVLQRM